MPAVRPAMSSWLRRSASSACDKANRTTAPQETIVMNHRVRFGIFLAPFHKPGINPTLALEQDLELIQWLDCCC